MLFSIDYCCQNFYRNRGCKDTVYHWQFWRNSDTSLWRLGSVSVHVRIWCCRGGVESICSLFIFCQIYLIMVFGRVPFPIFFFIVCTYRILPGCMQYCNFFYGIEQCVWPGVLPQSEWRNLRVCGLFCSLYYALISGDKCQQLRLWTISNSYKYVYFCTIF